MNRYVISLSFCLLSILITNGFTAQNSDDPGMQLHADVVSGNLDQVKSLISDGVDINTNNQLNWTPLHTAVRNNRLEIVKYLLENGANLDAVEAGGQTALHFAVESGQKEVVQLLIDKGAKLDIADSRRDSVLSLARKVGQSQIAEILIENGAVETNQGQRRGQNRGQRGMPPNGEFPNFNPDESNRRRGLRGNFNIPNTQNDIPSPVEVVDVEEPQPVEIMELPDDPNEIKSRISKFEGLDESIAEVSGKSRSIMRQWRNVEDDNRVAIARGVQRQLEYEMEFIKQTATEENAKNTVEAIDALIKTKDDTSRIIIRELTVKIREEQRESRATTTRTRGGRSNRARDTEDEEYTAPPEPREEETSRYDPNTQEELDIWLDASVTTDNSTLSFARTINERVREEFRPIRQIAAQENAEKTAAAIDGILLAREDRLIELEGQIETARARAENAEERSSRGRGRTDMGTDMETGGRRSRR